MIAGDGPLVRPNLRRLLADIEHLAAIRDIDEVGATRRVLTLEYAAGREWIAQRMREAALDVAMDPAGNLVGRRSGVPGALVTGSHTDTVRGGGRLDGPLGVLGAIEALRSLDEAGIELRHEFRLVDFLGEEPNDWGISCLGSRALVGELGPAELGCRAADGSSLADSLRAFGLDPDAIGSAAWTGGDVHAFVELHIEQGPVLEEARLPIGIVTGIVGVDRLLMEFSGRRDHAGTMPMALRHDAAVAAAEVVVAVEALAADGDGVGTCGRLEIEPGALNVVPDRATLGIELRGLDADWVSACRAAVEQRALDAGANRGVSVAWSDLSYEAPTPMAKEVQTVIAEAAHACGFPTMELPSGAEHDARRMAKLGPAGMIFVPSRGGRSHCPEEHTDPDQLLAGVTTLATTLLMLDRAELGSSVTRS